MAITRPTGDTAAKRRRQFRRSCAEALRALATRPLMDDESLDLSSFLVFNLENIYESINESALAWDDRNYWKKAEGLRENWRWSRTAAKKLEKMLLKNDFDNIQPFLITLIPHFSDINISINKRDADWWCGAFNALQKRAQKAEG